MGIEQLKELNEVSGTSFHGQTLTATAEELIRVFGPPTIDQNGEGDKTNLEWFMKTSDGVVFTVYDWKEYRKILLDEPIEWYIGTYERDDSNIVYNHVVRYLMDLISKY